MFDLIHCTLPNFHIFTQFSDFKVFDNNRNSFILQTHNLASTKYTRYRDCANLMMAVPCCADTRSTTPPWGAASCCSRRHVSPLVKEADTGGRLETSTVSVARHARDSSGRGGSVTGTALSSSWK